MGLLWATLAATAPTTSLEVDVDKLRSHKGQLRLCLTSQPDKFPSCVGDARAVRRSVAADGAPIRFDGLPSGAYAVAVIHDENDNRKLDTVLGVPREGFGFSRNPAIGFGAPRFSAASFALEGDNAQQRITMRYLL